MKRGLLRAMLGALAVAATVFACGGDDDAAGIGVFNPSGDGGKKPEGGFGEPGDSGSISTASGVVILHAAAFPPFRLCFENYPELTPQPNAALMPEANLVGVEMGSAVRIAQLPRAPGKVYVVDQRVVESTPRDPEDRTCGQLFANPNQFRKDRDYQLAGSIDEPIGANRVHVLAITGCGGKPWLDDVGLAPSDCPASDPVVGSLVATAIPVAPIAGFATMGSIPAQLFQISPEAEAQRDAGAELAVGFGPLDGGTAKAVSIGALFQGGKAENLVFDQSVESTFGSYGFQVSLGSKDGGVAVTQSLAQIQELSKPQAIATQYYLESSSYALLLVGDPRIQPRFADGGTDPRWSPRRGLHLLALPVDAPPDDAGAAPVEDAGTPDGG